MDHETGIGIDTPDFRSQLTALEYLRWQQARTTFIANFHLEVTNVERGEVVWYYGSIDHINRLEAWDVGYCMALGFDDNGIRQQL